MSWFSSLHPVMQGLLATLFTYFITALGASLVFFFKTMNKKVLDMMMGFAGGVMIAASFWSLIAPAMELSEQLNQNVCLIAAIGFLLGGFFIIGSDIVLSKFSLIKKTDEKVKRSILLTTAVTMHNIPEGLAVGVAFGCASLNLENNSLIAAILLAVGIGLQNFPEGTCVAMPLRREGVSRFKSFMVGQFSGIVEPIAGVLGVIFALNVQNCLPFALTFSAGAMISVVCSELIPESFKDSKTIATIGIMAGFVIMMVLDVSLG